MGTARLISANLNRIRNTYAKSYSYLNPAIQVVSPQLGDPSIKYGETPSFLIQRRWHIGHGHSHSHHDHQGEEGEKIFRLGLAADVGLATAKAFTGYVCGSTAIIADAAHSISDVVLSGVALLSYKAAKAPKDKEHPYGHGKFESLGALGISAMLLATGGGIAWHALDVLMGVWTAVPEGVNQSLAHQHIHGHHHGAGGHHHGIDMDHPVLALNMTILSIAVKEGLYWITKRAGERTGSGLMKANAWHHRADAVSSLVALIGVGGSFLGVKFFDPLAGLVVAGMILRAGLETGYQSVLELVDAAIPSHILEPFRSTILQVEGVKGCNHLRGRRAGSFLYLDVNIEVDPFSSVSAAHEVGEFVRHELQGSHPEVVEVFVHIDPLTLHLHQQNNKQMGCKNGNCFEHIELANNVSNILSSKFSEKIVVERITPHLLQGEIFLQVEVSMPQELLIRDAEKLASEAEELITETIHNVRVRFQLRLGRPMPPSTWS
ncbi:metal tolerance protein 2 [Ipomoea triloba]|uniref:metal tolerance protein 2 n=1 Tax=Ipomoea triloba TaxID=35885 RepID=UPI00125D89B2|nr:metal tolerance protein 2 [Ipomoea triloba]